MLYSYEGLNQTGAVPIFTEASTPELQNLLTSLREKVIIPAYLPKSQKDLIYKDKYKKLLASEPVTAYLGDEEFTLEHIDRRKDVPNTKKTVRAAIQLMKEKKDWDNLPNLLEGLIVAGYPIEAYREMIIRWIGSAGRQDIILECVRRVSDTKFTLGDPQVAIQVMLWMSLKGVQSNWNKGETRKALAWAEEVAMLMEDEKHIGSRSLHGENDSRIRPEILGILLELSAVRALKHQDGKDVDGKVAKYAERLLGLPSGFQEPKPRERGDLPALRGKRSDHPLRRIEAITYWGMVHLPILYGLKAAEAVLGSTSTIATRLEPVEKDLERMVEKYVSELAAFADSKGGKNYYSLQLYRDLILSKS
jgi:hypothetical protein